MRHRKGLAGYELYERAVVRRRRVAAVIATSLVSGVSL